jgi:hypothetical protein
MLIALSQESLCCSLAFANFMHSVDSRANYFWISPKRVVWWLVARVETPPPHVAAIGILQTTCVLLGCCQRVEMRWFSVFQRL